MPKAIDKPITRLRSSAARGLAKSDDLQIDRTGGMFGAGIIRGLAVVTRGEALGHGYWLDATFVEQTRAGLAALARSNGKGAKARFTHPGLSADGLGKMLGRVDNPRIEGDVLRGDLHIMEAAHNTPDGDLAEYVLDLAEQDPEAFGTSIVFKPNHGAANKFNSEHQNADGVFQSPDTDNTGNLPHARLDRLQAVDCVDEPAANPGGLFSVDPAHRDADLLARYVAGVTDDTPELAALDINPERARVFFTRFLHANNLELTERTMPDDPKPADDQATETPVDDQATETPDAPADPPADDAPADPPADDNTGDDTDGDDGDQAPADEPAEVPEGDRPVPPAPPGDPAKDEAKQSAVAELQKFCEAYGPENGPAWFTKGFSFEAAGQLHAELKRMQAGSSADDESDADGASAGDAPGNPAASKFANALGPKLGGYAASLKKAT